MTALPGCNTRNPSASSGLKIINGADHSRRTSSRTRAYDVTADQVAFQPINKVVGAGLLAAANEFACDLLVMGAYSHSRLRQFILAFHPPCVGARHGPSDDAQVGGG